jgi:hypothetical protein
MIREYFVDDEVYEIDYELERAIIKRYLEKRYISTLYLSCLIIGFLLGVIASA